MTVTDQDGVIRRQAVMAVEIATRISTGESFTDSDVTQLAESTLYALSFLQGPDNAQVGTPSEVERLIRKIADLRYVEDANEPFDEALDLADKALAALSAPDAQVSTIPEGWKLVPLELTEQMKLIAGHIADGPSVTHQEHWEMMLLAAPIPPVCETPK